MSAQMAMGEEIRCTSFKIDGKDAMGIFLKIELFENIYTPILTGSVTVLDSDGLSFLTDEDIEGNESFEFSFENSVEETIEFKGVLNGIRNKLVEKQRQLYLFDFTSETMRKDESQRVTKAVKNKSPEDVFADMVKLMGGKMDKSVSTGRPMIYNPPRVRPSQVMKYVLTHGVTDKAEAGDGEDPKQFEHESKGTTGFVGWQTMDGYRFASIDDMMAGKAGTDHGDYKSQLLNKGQDISELHKSILKYDFPIMGDIQSKMRSGAFRHKHVIFDMDKGLYKEYTYNGEDNMTDKQKEAVPEPTRIMFSMFTNESHQNECKKADPNTGDQSKLNTSQNTARENTCDDTQGNFLLNPQYKFRAGDTFTAKLGKVRSEDREGGFDEKHTGRYVIKEVAHHFSVDGKGYTRIGVIRSTIQQDDATSKKTA